MPDPEATVEEVLECMQDQKQEVVRRFQGQDPCTVDRLRCPCLFRMLLRVSKKTVQVPVSFRSRRERILVHFDIQVFLRAPVCCLVSRLDIHGRVQRGQAIPCDGFMVPQELFPFDQQVFIHGRALFRLRIQAAADNTLHNQGMEPL